MKIVERKDVPGLATLYLARFGGELAEFVDTLEPGVPKAKKWVMMISTQFGCPVGCRMCDAGAAGFRGNLTAEQMLAQVEHMARREPDLDIRRHPKVKIHFARMGEPALNPEVLEALRLLRKEYPGGGVMPSLSTTAPSSPAAALFFDELARLKDELFGGGRFQLQFSLHSLDEARRREIVPIPAWSLERVAEYGRRFVRPGDRKITLNFAPSPGETVDSAKLASIFPSESFLVKITPVNPTETALRRGAAHVWMEAPERLKACADDLAARGFRVILSPSQPEELSAETSCGQLWTRAMKGRAIAAFRERRLSEWKREIVRWERRAFALRADSAALLVVDMQELFLDESSPAHFPPAREILPNVERLVRAFRGARRPVYFTTHSDGGGLMRLWWRTVCPAGSPGEALTPSLEAPAESVFRKCRYNALTNPALRDRLRRDGIGQLVVAGVSTNLCVESTVRGAFDLGIQPFVVIDATAAHADELHLGALKSMAFGFACLRDTQEVICEALPEWHNNPPPDLVTQGVEP